MRGGTGGPPRVRSADARQRGSRAAGRGPRSAAPRMPVHSLCTACPARPACPGGAHCCSTPPVRHSCIGAVSGHAHSPFSFRTSTCAAWCCLTMAESMVAAGTLRHSLGARQASLCASGRKQCSPTRGTFQLVIVTVTKHLMRRPGPFKPVSFVSALLRSYTYPTKHRNTLPFLLHPAVHPAVRILILLLCFCWPRLQNRRGLPCVEQQRLSVVNPSSPARVLLVRPAVAAVHLPSPPFSSLLLPSPPVSSLRPEGAASSARPNVRLCPPATCHPPTPPENVDRCRHH